MTTVITAPTGNIGRELTRRLLDAGADVTLLVRDPGKVTGFAGRGAKVKQGSLDDPTFVLAATRGARQIFWLTPPDMQTRDLRARQNEFGAVGSRAVRENGIERVVHLSSIGAHMTKGTGPILGLHDNEQKFEGVAENVLHLRPGYFMENLLALGPSIALQKSIFMPMPADRRLPMVATRDIAAVAAAELLDDGWSGRRIRGIHGPEDIDWNRVAKAVSEALKETITYTEVPPAAVKQAFEALSLPEPTAEAMVEMLVGLGDGSIERAEKRDESTTTSTTIEEFVADTLVPSLPSPPPA